MHGSHGTISVLIIVNIIGGAVVKSFDEVAELLGREGADVSPSELQGFLCGHLCTGERDYAGWLRHARGFLDVGELSQDIKTLLLSLFEESEAHIKHADFEFALLLPADDEDLQFRSLLMGQWCQGFLTSFGMGCSEERAQQLSDEAKSTLGDLVAISQISDEDIDNDNTAESDFTEVAEYIRMAVLSLAMECRQPPAVTSSEAIH